ncbi:hypothetical protein FDP41_004470 [Naegleria fowleri]|uniref:GPI-anchored wall transfer protein n=1 Tax=Naegleria fowleri TaxID=5763 RepID=A0A6A5BQP3_NAEFO|nr:uncharacterized protein FDP41_004470 [Naegleria fowleri]KAF0976571.1 hypothetical protein FDP41_004470 [Naegleria fowleri]CAG4710616.1 unnamed protein product [Naegleria fowleri]
MSSISYRERQEDFVSDITGTTPLEVFGLSMSVVLIPSAEYYLKRFFFKGRFSRLLLEIIFKVVFYYAIETTIVLNRSVVGNSFSLGLVLLWSVMILFIVIFQKIDKHDEGNITHDENRKLEKSSQHIEFISEYRHSMQLSTIMAILMVDFQIFPRRLAKTENFGYSLMDLGVGSFVFSGAIVSSTARRVVNPSTPRMTFSKLIHSLLPLTLLAIFRFLSVKTMNYQTHVSEYGVHWNFFTTLVFLCILSYITDEVLHLTSSWKKSLIVGTLCALFQQWLLSGPLNLQHIILNGERTNLILANKEGFGTLLGYLSIHLIGVGVGQFTFNYHTMAKQYLKFLIMLTLITTILSFAPFYAYGGRWFIEPASHITEETYHYQINKEFFDTKDILFTIFMPSRRMTNFGYIVWSLSFNITLLTLFYWMSQITPLKNNISRASYTSVVRDAMNFNPLFSFLFANLITGAINLFFQTIDASKITSTIIILTYGFVVCLVGVFLYDKKRKIF